MPLGLVPFEIVSDSINAQWTASKKSISGREIHFVLRKQLKSLSRARPNITTVLLGVIAVYLVCSRLGPILTRVGESDIIKQEFQLFSEFRELEVYRIFRDATRVPGLFARRSRGGIIILIMGNRSSTRRDSSGNLKPPPSEPTNNHEAKLKPVKEVSSQQGSTADLTTTGTETTTTAPVKETRGSTSSEGGYGTKEKPIKFAKIEDNITTGDLAVFYREEGIPHFAIFVRAKECDPDFPLMLVKGKTKPMPFTSFNSGSRNAHLVSAATRIFYGDYRTVAVQHLLTDDLIPCTKVIELIEKVNRTAYTQKELDTIKNAKSDEERSAIVSAYMVAHFYKHLGMLNQDPSDVLPSLFQGMLKLSDSTYVKMPCVKEGPVAKGDPPLLSKIVEGVFPQPEVPTKPLHSLIDKLDTGDIVLLSGATSSGAVIKLFDQSQFSHVGIVLRTSFASQLLIWEASTNKAGLVDIETGKVRHGVELLPLRNKIYSGWYDRVAIRRLVDIDDSKRTEMYRELLKFRKDVQGKPYEKNKMDLILSVVNLHEWYLSFLRNRHEDLSSLFCSELVAAAYQRMGLIGTEKLPHEFTPDDFSSARNPKLNFGKLLEEVYIDLKFDFGDGGDHEPTVY